MTGVIVALLFLPLPFARFESWPGGGVIFERIVMPWSEFRVCYTSYPDGEPMEESFRFSWQGHLLAGDGCLPVPVQGASGCPLALKWRNAPELSLKEMFTAGGMLHVRTSWKPIILYPFVMASGLWGGK